MAHFHGLIEWLAMDSTGANNMIHKKVITVSQHAAQTGIVCIVVLILIFGLQC